MKVTISIGIAGGRGSELQLDMLVDRADAAMYAAKSLGRNRTYLYRELDDEAPVRRAPISASTGATGHRHRAVGQRHGHPGAGIGAGAAAASPRSSVGHDRVAGDRPGPRDGAAARGDRADPDRRRCSTTSARSPIPEEILDKPSTLSDAEWQAIGEHPRIGQIILEQASSLREAIPVVLHHHERYNGGGYPHGLRGNEIPLGARIVAVADAYHAMVHDRPYSSALGHEEALVELRSHAGTQFDPVVVDVFCDDLRRGRCRPTGWRRSTASTSARAAGCRTSRSPDQLPSAPNGSDRASADGTSAGRGRSLGLRCR